MRISAYHKAQGDVVEWWWSDFVHYDIVYKSKVFSDAYSKDVPDPVNADRIIKGGTGYYIHLVDGKEVFDAENHSDLPPEIEKMFPDYSIYPQHHFAVAMTSRGCPRGCAFCHVKSKEGTTHKVANVSDFYAGQDHIESLDPNILACKEKRDLLRQYRETKATVNFNQGLDIRLMTDADIDDLNHMRVKRLHFAWDNPADDLEPKFRYWKDNFRRKTKIGTVYVLTNFGSTLEQDLYRISVLRDMGFDPFVMIYDKPNAPPVIRHLQRWCNNKFVFKACPRFEDYTRLNNLKT